VNALFGNAGSNIWTAAQAPTMTGGAGNDAYFVDNISDQTIGSRRGQRHRLFDRRLQAVGQYRQPHPARRR
jgi:hypothetical protein